MREYYLCIFCDSVVFSAEELENHLIISHFNGENDCQKTITQAEDQYIQCFIEYQTDLNRCFQLRPKELPQNNVEELFIGCPLCDRIIDCFELIPNKSEDKYHCFCGKTDQNLDDFKCVECDQTFHRKCDLSSTYEKCSYCDSKAFNIYDLRDKERDEQQNHCYQHLNYYPFVCRFILDANNPDNTCDKRFFSFNASKTHLRNHNVITSGDVDVCNTVTRYYDFNSIDSIFELINNRLKSFSKVNHNREEVDVNHNIQVSNTTSHSYDSNTRSLSHYRIPKLVLKRNRIHSSEDFNEEYQTQTRRKQKLKNKKTNSYNRSTDSEFDESFAQNSSTSAEKSSSKSNIRQLKPINYIGRGFKNNCESIHEKYRTDRSRGKPRKDSIESDLEIIEDSAHYSVSDWFTNTKRVKFPYFPQKDDEVVYIPYGHDLYNKEVNLRGIYNQSNKSNNIRFHVNEVIFAKVTQIHYIFKEKRDHRSLRLVYVSLKPYDQKYGKLFKVRYHDMKGVIDFIILRKLYDSSLFHNWRIGDAFRAVVDDQYWFGTIEGLNEEPYCQISMFKKYFIKWGNNTHDLLSPWDLEPIDPLDLPMDKSVCIPVTDSDREKFFESDPNEWPKYDEIKECKRVANGLKIVQNLKEATEHSFLDDITDNRYRRKVVYPIDLKTIIARVENHYYRSQLAIKYDIKYLESNVRNLIKSVKRDPDYKFEPQVAKSLKYNAKFVTALSLRFIDAHECINPLELYESNADYLETHDIKCYSAKRVHLNLVRKDSLESKMKKINKNAIIRTSIRVKNTHSKSDSRSTPRTDQLVLPFDDSTVHESNYHFKSYRKPSYKLMNSFDIESDSDHNSYTDFDYSDDDSEADPDFKTTKYYRSCR